MINRIYVTCILKDCQITLPGWASRLPGETPHYSSEIGVVEEFVVVVEEEVVVVVGLQPLLVVEEFVFVVVEEYLFIAYGMLISLTGNKASTVRRQL